MFFDLPALRPSTSPLGPACVPARDCGCFGIIELGLWTGVASEMPGCLLEASRGGCPFPRAPFSGWQATVVKGLSFAGTQFF